jgi:hypothetical protein
MKLRVAEAAISLALLLALGLPPPAHARGFGGHSFAGHIYRGFFHSYWWRYGFWRNGYGSRYGYAGGNGGSDYYWPPSGYGNTPTYSGYPIPPPIQFVFVATRPMCQPSVETVTVPSEDGGTSQITIRRCMR